ncbi:hypothetical protein MASR2M36_33720 [Providencia sp.]
MPETLSTQRQQIRQSIRQARRQLSDEQQTNRSSASHENALQCILRFVQSQHIALFLSF